jgi:hypothetical protein
MKRTLAICGALLLTAVSVARASEVTSFRLDITRNGVTDQQVVFDSWNDDLKSAVIDINSGIKGTTTVKGFTSIRTPDDKMSCTIRNGLYHPTTKGRNSGVNFLTVAQANEYVVTRETAIEFDETLETGSRVRDIVALGGNLCAGRLETNRGDRNIYMTCSDVQNEEQFMKVAETRDLNEQWMQLSCLSGGSIYVQAKDLLSQKGVKVAGVATSKVKTNAKKISKAKKTKSARRRATVSQKTKQQTSAGKESQQTQPINQNSEVGF